MRRVREDRIELGASAYVPDVRRHTLLRQLAEPARNEARTNDDAPGHCVGGTWRTVAVLLPRRCLRRVLSAALRRISPIQSSRSTTFASPTARRSFSMI